MTKMVILNASPRKDKNTATLLKEAQCGAEEMGAVVEYYDLIDLQFSGCRSCMACKYKGNKCDGVCVVRDDLRPVLESIRTADALIIGSPIYWSYPTGMIRSLMERLMFPVGTYMYERLEGYAQISSTRSTGACTLGRHITLRDKVIPTAMILTMNCPEDYMRHIGYPAILDENAKPKHNPLHAVHWTLCPSTSATPTSSTTTAATTSNSSARRTSAATATSSSPSTSRTHTPSASAWWRKQKCVKATGLAHVFRCNISPDGQRPSGLDCAICSCFSFSCR